METLESLRRQIATTRHLHTVVRTMKVLSMTSIRQCERAVESIADYDRTVRLGLQAALRHRPRRRQDLPIEPAGRGRGAVGGIVFGSTWGMCGRFNELLADSVAEAVGTMSASPVRLLAMGEYVTVPLERAGCSPEEQAAAPESVDGITQCVQDLLIRLERWRTQDGIHRLVLFYNELTSGSNYYVETQSLLPIDRDWLAAMQARPWPTAKLPTYRTGWDDLLKGLLRQYLFVSLYRAFAESLASEHTSRLSAMQNAESNVEDRLDDLQNRFHRRRQTAITEEVLDIAAGFEALQGDPREGDVPR